MSGLEDRGLNSLEIDGPALWKGCILASCVHAVMLPEYPFILNENTWSGGIYVTQNDAGAKGALYFSEENELVLGMFRDFTSPRTRLVLSEQYAESHYREAPEELRDMARVLSMLFEARAGEKDLPFVTAGFWGEAGRIISCDDEEKWFRHGGHVLEAQMMPFEEAMAYFEVTYSMDGDRMKIAERLYRERIKAPGEKAILTRKEIDVLTETGPYNMEACREVFEQFGVEFEKE